jgi:SAM-dependent methyltransferase
LNNSQTITSNIKPSAFKTSNAHFFKERRSTRRFFNIVAGVYFLVEKHLRKEYRKMAERLALPADLSVLDIACGSGLLGGTFAGRGHRALGIDFSVRLLARANRLYPMLETELFDLIKLPQKATDSWDIVTIGYLLHGVSYEFRHFILKESARISRGYVLVCDYGEYDDWLVRLIEWMEGPHYFQYKKLSRQAEFEQAGLKIIRDEKLSDYGRYWLCTVQK